MANFMRSAVANNWLEEVTEIDVIKCSNPYDRRQDTIKIASEDLIENCGKSFNYNKPLNRVFDWFL